MRRRRLSSSLYQLARTTNTIDALTSGDPKRMARRTRNIILGRALARGGVWRALWR
jgi:hypothetical protein